MKTIRSKSLRWALALTTLVGTASAQTEAPLLSVDVQSYTAALDSATRLAEAIGAGTRESVESSLTGLTGEEALQYVDQSKPLNFGLWMSYFGQPPLKALHIPVTDFEAFRTAVLAHSEGIQNATILEQGEYALLIEDSANPDAEIAAPKLEQIRSHFKGVAAPSETMSATIHISESLRPMMLGGLEMGKGMMLAQMQTLSTDETPVDPAMLTGIMETYFNVLRIVARDTSDLTFTFSTTDSELNQSIVLAPKADSELAGWFKKSTPDLRNALGKVNWDADMAVAVGMGPLDAGSRKLVNDFLRAFAPMYGWNNEDVEQWMALVDQSLPATSAYSMSLEDTFQFDGFYELPEGQAQEVYQKMIELSEKMPTAPETPESYYSEISVEKGVREINGHSVDQWHTALNLDHPTLQTPEQKAQMLQFFPEGKVVYESTLIDDALYIASDGHLKNSIERSGQKPPFPVSEQASAAGSVNFIKFMQSSLKGQPGLGAEFGHLDPEGTRVWFTMESDKNLQTRMGIPFKLLSEFGKTK